MVDWTAVGILTANISDFAGINTLVIKAGLSGRAVILLRTFKLFAFCQWISSSANRAGAEGSMSDGIAFSILTAGVFTSILTFPASAYS